MYLKLEKEQISIPKVVYNNQKGSPSLAVNLALNEILIHKVSVDIDTLFLLYLHANKVNCMCNVIRQKQGNWLRQFALGLSNLWDNSSGTVQWC